MIKPSYEELEKRLQTLQMILDDLSQRENASCGPSPKETVKKIASESQDSLLKQVIQLVETNDRVTRELQERRCREEELRYQATQLESLIERGLLGIVTLDTENRIVSCNEFFEKIFQHPKEEIVGQDLDRVVAGDLYWQEARANTEKVFSGKTIHNIGKRKRKDGSCVDVEIFGVPIVVDEKVAGLYFIYLDISERKRMEDALRESEEKYRNILENIEEGYYEVDLKGNFTFFNRALCRVLGYAPDELLGKNNRLFMDEDNAKKIYQTFNQVFSTGVPAEGFTWEIIAKDGGKRSAEISVALLRNDQGDPIGFRGIGRDITERKQMELELVQTKNFLQSIIESSIDGITITDLQGIIIYASPSVLDILGYHPKEIIGQKVSLWYGNGLMDAKKIMKALTQKGELRNHEMHMLKKSGKPIDVNLSAALLKNQKGTVIGTMGIYRDITQKKALEKQLLQVQKLEALGTLAGGIAHNFNNLLMGILGNTSLMLLDVDPGHAYYKRLKTIEDLIQNGSKLTSQLLGYAREGKYEPRPLPLNQIVKEIAQTFGMTRKEVSIHYDLADHLLMAVIDKNQIEQVLLNLFINAVDAMPHGGQLRLQTRNVARHEISGLPVEPQKEHYVLLSVGDTGVGMDQQTISRLFEPFYTTKGFSRGTGLGLASAYGIVKAHQGYIKVESQKGVGTTFYIYLPAVKDSTLAMSVSEFCEVQKERKSLLLVDDETPILEIGREMIETLGYGVYTAKSGQEALDVYRKYREQIDAVILDMVMPDKSGGETFDQMREINPEVKVLLSSGYSINGKAGEIMERGCKGFLQKPFNLDVLSQKIREILS